jgi:hypothetical protein
MQAVLLDGDRIMSIQYFVLNRRIRDCILPDVIEFPLGIDTAINMCI